MAGWSIPIGKLVKKAGGRIDLVARKATLDLFAAAVRRSPVDTGRFKANWNVNYGAPNVQTSTSTAGARSTAEVNKVLSLPVGGKGYLTNSLPYAIRLEYGWSKRQAPMGMVRVTAREWSAKLSAANKGS